MEAKILDLITKLQFICLPWEDDEIIKNDWYTLPDDMAEMLGDFLKYAKSDYALRVTPPIIRELAKWLMMAQKSRPNDENHQFAEFWSEMFWEAYRWLGWIREYYPDALPDDEDAEPLNINPPASPADVEPLPDNHPLNSPQFAAILAQLAAHGFIKQDGNKWIWQETKALYGYFIALANDKFNLRKGVAKRRDWKIFKSIFTNTKSLEQAGMSRNSNFKNGKDEIDAAGKKYEILESIIQCN